MATQTITWTALPNGYTPTGKLKLSVFVAPRLTPASNTTLSAGKFHDFVNWPSVLAGGINWTVTFNTGQTITGPAVTRVGPTPRSDLWTALFLGSTPVRPFKFKDFQNLEILSYPAPYLQQFLKKLYVSLAVQSGTDHPHIDGLIGGAGTFQDIGFYPAPRGGDPERRARLLGKLREDLKRYKTIKPVKPGSPDDHAKNFLQLQLFHKPMTSQRVQLPNLQDPAVASNLIDFHQALAALGEHAEVLRILGLVHDLELTPHESVPVQGAVKVSASYTSATQAAGVSTNNLSPWTRHQLGSGKFVAAPRVSSTNPSDLSNGMLKLNDLAAYDIVQVDLDGAAIKAMNFAETLLRSLSPDHRSQDTPSEFAAPSLRTAGISVTRLGRASRFHEAVIGTASKNSAIQQGNVQNLMLDADDLVRGYRLDVQDVETNKWYSLCRREVTYRFGPTGALKITSDPDTDEGQVTLGMTTPANGSGGQARMSESIALWQGWSLVAPRPGKTINKEGMPEEVANAPVTAIKLQSQPVAAAKSLPRLRYGKRYRIRARAADLAGNSAPHTSTDASTASKEIAFGRYEPVPSPTLLFRKSPTTGETVERLVIRSYEDAESSEIAERHVAPPKTSQLQAERHGMFDSAPNDDLDSNRYLEIVQRESGSFSNLDGKSDPTFDVPQVTVPYLPDPFARGAAFRFLPGMPANPSPAYATKKADFSPESGLNWPKSRAFRIEVHPDLSVDPSPRREPHFDEGARVFHIYVRKADDVKARLSSFLHMDDLAAMGLVHWVSESQAASAHEVKLQAERGAHWMITPHRPLQIVYAVQRPLIVPEWHTISIRRNLGETFARLTHESLPHMPISGKSTSTLDVWGEWREPQDLVSEPTPRWLPWNNAIEGKSKALELNLKKDDVWAVIRDRWHEFGDTKHRMVAYTAVANSRFKEYFANSTLDFTRTSKEQLVDIPSSARPDAPKVKYIVPTFSWQRMPTQSTRRGNGLRVYLDRPWYSSGEGELLGVVVTTGGVPSERLKPYVTQWGKDPLWAGPNTDPLPTVNAFKNRLPLPAVQLTLDELQKVNTDGSIDHGPTVTVAAFEPQFDEDRKLWYVDIEIDAGDAYYPFIRLALVRYQPSSIVHAHLSRVITADFAQLAPDRTATIMNPTSAQVIVQVTGVSYSQTAGTTNNSHLAGPGQIEVTVEDEDPSVSDPILKWKPLATNAGPFTLAAVAGPAGTTIWTGLVPRPTNTRCRLVIREFERLPADGIVTLNNPSGVTVARRLVYAETLVLEP